MYLYISLFLICIIPVFPLTYYAIIHNKKTKQIHASPYVRSKKDSIYQIWSRTKYKFCYGLAVILSMFALVFLLLLITI